VRRRARRCVLAGCAALALGGLVYLHVAWIGEAYGAGPPYYGRTTNMDKWSDPLPRLLVIDLGALALVGVVARRLRRG
jgi:hypothetical protein